MRNVDRAGVVLGIIIAVYGWWIIAMFRNDPTELADHISVAAICGMVGFGLSRTIGYSFPFENQEREKTVFRMSSFYHGASFGCALLVILRFDASMPEIVISAIVCVGGGGSMLHFLGARRRSKLSREGYGFDFENPVDFDSRKGRNLRRFPYLMIFAVGYIAYFNGDPIRTLGVWALWLCLIPPIYPSTNSVLWKLIGYLWVAFCFGVVTYIEFAF